MCFSGEVWPLPLNVTTFNNFTHNINPTSFKFTTQLTNCDILQQAFQRYQKWTFPGNKTVGGLKGE